MTDSWKWYGGVPQHSHRTRHAERLRTEDQKQRYAKAIQKTKETILQIRTLERDLEYSKAYLLQELWNEFKDLGYHTPHDFEENKSWELIQQGTLKHFTDEFWSLRRQEPSQSDHTIYTILETLMKKYPEPRGSRIRGLDIDNLY